MAGTCGHRSATPSPLQLFTDGITNKLVACYTDEDMADAVLVRVYGRKTELFVDRETELRNFQVLRAHGCAPDLYCAFQNGLCYEFLPGIALGPDHVRDPRIFRCVGPAVLGHMGSGREQGEVGPCFQLSSFLPSLQTGTRDAPVLSFPCPDLGGDGVRIPGAVHPSGAAVILQLFVKGDCMRIVASV